MGQFRDRMDEELRIRGYSTSTRECYVRCVRNVVRHFMQPPDQLRGGRDEAPRQQLKQAARKPWVVYSKPPFASAEQVLAYLGRYAYRIALSNDRLVGLRDGQVTVRWKDRAHGHAPRLATLDARTFLRRFLLHVLPRPLRPDPPLRLPR